MQVPVGRLARQDPAQPRRRGPRPRRGGPEVGGPTDLEVALAVEVGGADVRDAVGGVDLQAEQVRGEGLLIVDWFGGVFLMERSGERKNGSF